MSHLKVHGQDVYALVDSGSPYTFFVSKYWYEGTRSGDCEEIVSKCYECRAEACQEGPVRSIRYSDKTTVTMFERSGKIDFGKATASGMKIYLMTDCNRLPFASLGLAPPHTSCGSYAPTILQLLDRPKSRRLIKRNAFSVYLSGGDHPAGELILGGQDKSKYRSPLEYVTIVDKTFPRIVLSGIEIGTTFYAIKGYNESSIDTGTNTLTMPKGFKAFVMQSLRTGGERPVNITEVWCVYNFMRRRSVLAIGQFPHERDKRQTAVPPSATLQLRV
ncbi:hypothetical protein FOZ62_032250 [Perkinsus olseni]|uniref:Peptidase A1 domain-containing protein n=1 Tax=Perkinsus olseni TaxID=32597 RepID=A0A7J6PXC0_PEROL|nr:hypothetical protein FOZ62_032250 [Perkinsus olseni]